MLKDIYSIFDEFLDKETNYNLRLNGPIYNDKNVRLVGDSLKEAVKNSENLNLTFFKNGNCIASLQVNVGLFHFYILKDEGFEKPFYLPYDNDLSLQWQKFLCVKYPKYSFALKDYASKKISHYKACRENEIKSNQQDIAERHNAMLSMYMEMSKLADRYNKNLESNKQL